MPSIKRKRPKGGDVIEIKTPKGFVYVQYNIKYPRYADVIRVLPGLYPRRLSSSEIRELVRQKERFVALALPELFMDKRFWDWEAEIVAHEEVPEHARSIPLWRRTMPGRGKDKWVLVVRDERGNEYFRPAIELTPEEFWKLPHDAFYGPDSLQEMLMDQEWTWEKEREGAIDPFGEGEEEEEPLGEGMFSEEVKEEQEKTEEGEKIDQNLPYVVHHYLYFPRKRQAEAFVKEIQEKGKAYKVLMNRVEGEYSVVLINWVFADEEFF
ncbi:MAG: hypothetical protein QXT26_07290 [Thermoproteota archaeon]